ncbi:TPA: type IV conjugative transfer system lipoprotein TraV [Aeromonas veronii]
MLKHVFWFPLFCSLFTLGGCSGTASDFQCNATTSDQCMTMEEANNLARKKTEGAKGKPDAGKLPALVDIPPSPVQPLTTPVMSSSPGVAAPLASEHSSFVAPSSAPRAKTASRAVFIPSRGGLPPLQTEAVCATPRCDVLGEATPLRLTDSIGTVWIAPWVDTADVFHQPGRLSFVVTPGTWQLPQQLQ